MKHLRVHAVDEEEHAGLDGAARQPQEDVGAIFELSDELLDLRFDVVRSPYWRAVAQEAALQPAPVTNWDVGQELQPGLHSPESERVLVRSGLRGGHWK
jgi:hypothetical protein